MSHLVGNALYFFGGGMIFAGMWCAMLARVNFSPEGEQWFGGALRGRGGFLGVVLLWDRTLFTNAGWRYRNAATVLLVGGFCLLCGGLLAGIG
jgi:hypothetical protein